ncbi:MAG: hypothetical protein ABIB71_08520 [Candidatus Woesearchaeota archaeon]
MNTLQKIFEGKVDGAVHKKFTRYGKGEYERFLFEIKKGKNLNVKSSFDFANDFVEIIAARLEGNANVSGKVVAAYDLEKDFPIEATFSKRGKLHTAELSTEVSAEQLRLLYDKYKDDFLLLNIKSDKFKLKSGKSLPKPGGKIKPNFCSASLPLDCKDEFAWDVNDFKELKIAHVLKIDEVEFDKELMKTDPAKARLEAKRKGTIIRKLDIDGKIEEKEAEFSA